MSRDAANSVRGCPVIECDLDFVQTHGLPDDPGLVVGQLVILREADPGLRRIARVRARNSWKGRLYIEWVRGDDGGGAA